MADLMRQLQLCRDLNSLSSFFVRNAQDMNGLHEAALCSLLAHSADRENTHPLFFAVASSWLERDCNLIGRGSRQASNIFWASAKLRYPSSSILVNRILGENARLAKHFDAQQSGSTLWACATHECTPSTFLTVLIERAVELSPSFEAQTAANVLWAVCTLDVSDPLFIAAIVAAAARNVEMFLPQHASISLWSAASMGISILFPGVKTLIDACLRLREGMNAQEISNTLYACGKLNITDMLIITPLLESAAKMSTSFCPQNSVNCLQALALISFNDPSNTFLLIIVSKAFNQRADFNHQEAACVFWALASIGLTNSDTWLPFADTALNHAPFFSKQQTVMCFWGLATLSKNHCDTYLTLAFSKQAASIVASCDIQSAVTCLWAAATLKCPSRLFLSEFAEAVLYYVPFLSPELCVKAIWSCARLSLDCALVDSLFMKVGSLLSEVSTGRGIATLMYSAAVLNLPETFFQLLERAIVLSPLLNFRDSCEILWTLAVFNEKDPTIWSQFGSLLNCHSQMSYAEAHQLVQAQKISAVSFLSPQFMDYFASLQQPPLRISIEQRAVASHLSEMGYSVRLEVLVNGHSVDMLVQLRDSPLVAVEFDGPTHFLVPLSRSCYRYNGRSVLRDNLLSHSGVKLVKVPFYEWDHLLHQERKDYLARKMKKS